MFRIEETKNNFDLRDKDGKHVEPSAVEPINERFFLVACDKVGDLFVVEKNGKIAHTLKLKGFKKPKWEALGFDGEYYYVVGSHAVKLDDTPEKLSEKLAQRSRLLRFKLKNTGGAAGKMEIAELLEMNVSESLAADGLYDADPFKNKVKIEGLAVRTRAGDKKEIVFALREPHDRMHVFSARLPENPKGGERLAPKPFFTFEAGRIGTIPFRLSSIEYAPEWSGFFMMTSTENTETNDFAGNALWFVEDEAIRRVAPCENLTPHILWLFAVDMKAEGLCILPGASKEKLRLALVFDNDYEDTGKHGKLLIIKVSRV